jgi:hypothetical protein
MANHEKDTLASFESSAGGRGAPGQVRLAYVAPCVEEDLPLEVMSLACSGFIPKSAPPLCRTIGSLVSQQRVLPADTLSEAGLAGAMGAKARGG